MLMAAAGLGLAAEPVSILKGRVTDASGAAIAGSTVVVREMGGLAIRGTTDEQGGYRIEDLAPGTYALSIGKPGFTPYMATVKILTKGGTVTLDSQLPVASAARAVNVDEPGEPAPDLRPLLREAAKPKWAHVKLLPKFDFSAPPAPTGTELAKPSPWKDAALAAYHQPSQLAHVFEPGRPDQQAAIRFRFTF